MNDNDIVHGIIAVVIETIVNCVVERRKIRVANITSCALRISTITAKSKGAWRVHKP